MCCPCCRNGVRGKLQASSLPLHLRGPIQNRTQRERRAQILEEQEEDRLVAEALSDSTQAVIQPTVYPTLGLRSILHSDVTARLALYASEEGNEGERQPLSVANLKPLVYDSLYGLIVLQTDYFDCPLTGDVEITVTATVSTKIQEKTVFLIEAKQAGIFEIRHVPQEQLGAIVGIACPQIVYPYLRANVADVIQRAGFPPVHLAEINFQTMYEQQQNNAQNPQATQ